MVPVKGEVGLNLDGSGGNREKKIFSVYLESRVNRV